jgi:thymidine kinase
MAELRFSFGTMGSGKSTMALQIHHNLQSRGFVGVLCSQLDRQGARVSSALGVSAEAIEVGPTVDLFALAATLSDRYGRLHYLVCDEAQFYAVEQIDQLARVVDELEADVYAFGLLTSFQGRLFPGTKRLLELADQSEELGVQARCWCGRRATHNARLVDGRQVYEGELQVVDDAARAPEVRYELRCRRHWLRGENQPEAPDPIGAVARVPAAPPSLFPLPG